MNKNILLVAAFSCFAAFGFAQIKVVAPNGDTGIGTDSPTEKLEVDGSFSITAGNEIKTYLSDGVTKASLFRMDAGDNMILNQSASPNFGGNASGVTAVIAGNKDFTVTGNSGSIFRVKGSNSNVAIGYFNAVEKLAVNGNIFYSGALVPSDSRLKDNVVNFKDGLETVMKMKPIKYNYNGKAGLDPSVDHIGVYAQELQEIAPYLVKDWIYEEADANDKVVVSETYLKIDDTSIKYLLVNAIQEQQAIIADLQDQVKALAEVVASQSSSSNDNTQVVNLEAQEENYVGQNRPNPFDVKTVIDYKVSPNAESASMVFFDGQGKILKELALDLNNNQIEVNGDNLPAGVYSYQLKVDNTIIGYKKMVLSK